MKLSSQRWEEPDEGGWEAVLTCDYCGSTWETVPDEGWNECPVCVEAIAKLLEQFDDLRQPELGEVDAMISDMEESGGTNWYPPENPAWED